MKRKTVLISAVAIIFMAGTVFTGCKDKDKAEEKAKQEQEQMQKSFEQKLSSYPSEFKAFVSEIVKSGMFQQDQKVKLGLAKLQGKLTYKKGGKTYEGTLKKPVYAKMKNGDMFCLRSGAEIQDYGKKSVTKFTIEPFPGKWKVKNLLPVNYHYALTVVDRKGKHTGPAYESYEALAELWGNPEVYVKEPRPKYMVKKEDQIYLVKKEGEFWNLRPERK